MKIINGDNVLRNIPKNSYMSSLVVGLKAKSTLTTVMSWYDIRIQRRHILSHIYFLTIIDEDIILPESSVSS